MTTDRPQNWRIFALCSVVVFMVSLDATVVVAAFPTLRKHFAGATPAELSWSLNGYTIVYASLLITAGRLATRFGCKACFLGGTALFTLASGSCALAENAFWLATFRVLQAVGAAILTPASLTLALTDLPVAQRQKTISLWTAVGALAATIGPFVGSAIIQWMSWPMIFLINLPIGIFVCWRGRSELSETAVSDLDGPFDFAGTALLIAGIGSLAYGIVEVGETGRTFSANWGAWTIGVTCLLSFYWRARKRPDGALDLRLFRDPNYRWASVATFVFGAAFSLMFFSFYLMMTGIWHFSSAGAGLAATPGPLTVMLVIVLTSHLAGRLGHRSLLIAGGMLYGCGNLWFYGRLGEQPAYFEVWLPGQLVSALGIGLLLPTLTGAAVLDLAPQRIAVGSAVNSALRQLGGSIGVAIGVAWVGSVQAGVNDFRNVYGFLALSGLAVAGLSFPIHLQRTERFKINANALTQAGAD